MNKHNKILLYDDDGDVPGGDDILKCVENGKEKKRSTRDGFFVTKKLAKMLVSL